MSLSMYANKAKSFSCKLIFPILNCIVKVMFVFRAQQRFLVLSLDIQVYGQEAKQSQAAVRCWL